ncbi:MAG TPA: hypothetical protein DEP72_07950 [Clostridiales bacterium]|nr:MAG: hypothetical protein A2Y18_06605 [Clostridiales bacterium GWD2_32_19]HCC08069.1 hypothetical protein [Clostridiales bacterium]
MDDLQERLLEDTSFLVIDFETVTPKGIPPEPIELGILRINNGYEIDYQSGKSTFIKPPVGIHLTSFDTVQTGITEKDLVDSPNSVEIMKRLDRVCGQKEYIFIAQNAKYEANIISRYVEENPNLAKTKFIDTILLAKNVVPGLANYKLDTIVGFLSIEPSKDRHRALPDCILTAQVFVKLLELTNKKKKITFIRELLEICEIQAKHSTLDKRAIPKQISIFDI